MSLKHIKNPRLGMRRKYQSKEEVIGEIREIAERLGRVPLKADVYRVKPILYLNAREYFSNWREVIIACGLEPYRATPRRWVHSGKTKEQQKELLMELLNEYVEMHGRYPSTSELIKLTNNTTEWPSYSMFKQLVGEEFSRLRKQQNIKYNEMVSQFLNNNPGLTFKELGRRLNISQRAVLKWVVHTGYYNKYIQDNPFLTIRELANKLQTTDQYAGKIIKEAGGRPFQSVGDAELYKEKVLSGFPGTGRGREYLIRHYQGESLEQIGQTEGLSRERVRKLIIRYINNEDVEKRNKLSLEESIDAVVNCAFEYGPTAFIYNEYINYSREDKNYPTLYYMPYKWSMISDKAQEKIIDMVLSKSIDRLFDSEDILVKSNERIKFKTLSLEESVNVVADCALKYGPSAFRLKGYKEYQKIDPRYPSYEGYMTCYWSDISHGAQEKLINIARSRK